MISDEIIGAPDAALGRRASAAAIQVLQQSKKQARMVSVV